MRRQEKQTGVLLPCCAICEQVPPEGIKGGIKIRRGFICSDCEKTIIGIDASSREYNRILLKIRAIMR